MSAPHHPNQNPTEHYMEIIMGKTRSLLYIAGLDPKQHWEHAIRHSVCLQNRLTLPGRPTPYELTYGKKPDISHIRVFGCQAFAYIEKAQRHKLDFKAEACIYIDISYKHSPDTHTLLRLSNNEVIYRRNVSFNERVFPARLQNPVRPITKDKGETLIGTTFTQDNDTFVITNCSYHQGEDCLDYKNTETNEEHYSTLKKLPNG